MLASLPRRGGHFSADTFKEGKGRCALSFHFTSLGYIRREKEEMLTLFLALTDKIERQLSMSGNDSQLSRFPKVGWRVGDADKGCLLPPDPSPCRVAIPGRTGGRTHDPVCWGEPVPRPQKQSARTAATLLLWVSSRAGAKSVTSAGHHGPEHTPEDGRREKAQATCDPDAFSSEDTSILAFRP